MKEAAKLKKGDRVWLTRDERTWVVKQHYLFGRDVEVLIAVEGDRTTASQLRLRGAAALRSLQVAR